MLTKVKIYKKLILGTKLFFGQKRFLQIMLQYIFSFILEYINVFCYYNSNYLKNIKPQGADHVYKCLQPFYVSFNQEDYKEFATLKGLYPSKD